MRNRSAKPGAHPAWLAARGRPHQDADARRYPAWHADVVCRDKLPRRQADQPDRQAPSHQEWLAFLKTINREIPAGLAVHLIADNYATHQHPKVTAWLAKHPRFHMHFTPTSSSWLNLVERFFRDLTDFITEKSFASLAEAIIGFWAQRNANARRYIWRAKGEHILRKIAAARPTLAAVQTG